MQLPFNGPTSPIPRRVVGLGTLVWVLIAYALTYPAINAAQHGTFVRIPAFGVPFSAGVFSGVRPVSSRSLPDAHGSQ